MKNNLFLTLIMGTLLWTACAESAPDAEEKAPIGKATIKIADGKLTPEVLQLFGAVSDVKVSPDYKSVLYGVSYTDIAENKRNRELFVVNLDGTDKTQITHSPKSEASAQWIKGGEKIAFLSEGQIWEMNPDGSDRRQLSSFIGRIEGFSFSPDEKQVLFISQVKSYTPTSETYPDLNKATGRVIDNLMYKHWDEWVTTVPHPFLASFDGDVISNAMDILEGEPYEAPMKPFGGIEQFDWSPDSQVIAYTSRKKTGKEYAQSTNSDIYLYNIDTKETTNISQGMMGYDINPSFSPDGQYIAWQSMEREGYESDKNRLILMNLHTGGKKDLTQYFDYNIDDFCWDNHSQHIYMVSNQLGTNQLFKVNATLPVENTPTHIIKVTEGIHDYTSVAFAGEYLVGIRRSMSCPPEVYTVNLENKEQTNISHENDPLLNQITMGKVEERWIKTTDGKDMLTWVVFPPNFDPNKKYPALLYCQGGPQSTVSQFWSTRWNLQLMAANDYIIVAPNRRGLPGFGQAWNEQISGDYGGQNMKDYFSAIDAVSAEAYVDESRLGATGASYGGFSVFWLAGNHNKRFKAFLAHAGIFNLEAQYLETEEMWFADWDLGGPFWNKSNATAQRTFANSPHRFVEKWDTPIMITHGELDYRILASQGMMAFNAAQLRNIPSRMLVYPDENHWILQPQNGILFQREFFKWFDTYLK